MILLIDNYDSFTYNLYQYLGEHEKEVIVRRNDRITTEDIHELQPEAIVLSPGPGYPEDAGNCIEIIQTFYQQIPMLGICLGHQAIGSAFGAIITPAQQMKHGKTSSLKHEGKGLFQSITMPIEVMRYHSLIIEKQSLPEPFEVMATAMDDDEIMAFQHPEYPLYALQFHPESIGTEAGKQMLGNFLREVKTGIDKKLKGEIESEKLS